MRPALEPGDVVISDNLNARRSERAGGLLGERGARFLDLPPHSSDLSPSGWPPPSSRPNAAASAHAPSTPSSAPQAASAALRTARVLELPHRRKRWCRSDAKCSKSGAVTTVRCWRWPRVTRRRRGRDGRCRPCRYRTRRLCLQASERCRRRRTCPLGKSATGSSDQRCRDSRSIQFRTCREAERMSAGPAWARGARCRTSHEPTIERGDGSVPPDWLDRSRSGGRSDPAGTCRRNVVRETRGTADDARRWALAGSPASLECPRPGTLCHPVLPSARRSRIARSG